MIDAFSPFVALRYLLTRRINILGVFGVAFAVWAMLVVDGVFSGFVTDIRDSVRQSAPELLLTDLPHDTGYEALREVLEADPDVRTTAPRLRHHGLFQPVATPAEISQNRSSDQLEFDHNENGFAILIGIDPLREPDVVDLASWLRKGPAEIARYGREDPASEVLNEPDPERRARLLLPDRVEWRARLRNGVSAPPDPRDHRSVWPGILLGWSRVYDLRWMRPGDPLQLMCAAFPTENADGPVLRTDSKRMAFAGWFGTGQKMFDMTTALVPIDTLRTMLGHNAYDPFAIDLVTDIAIRPRDGIRPGELTALQQRLQAAIQQHLPAGSPPCAVLDWQQQNSVYLSAVAQEQAMMEIVLFVVMLVSAFVIYATLHMMVTQKVKDIGILAAIGGSPRSIGAVFLVCGSVVGVLGTAAGIAAGLASAVLLNPLNDWVYEVSGYELFPRHLFDVNGVPCTIEPEWVVTVATLAIVLAVVVAALPARKAARMNPVTALSFE